MQISFTETVAICVPVLMGFATDRTQDGIDRPKNVDTPRIAMLRPDVILVTCKKSSHTLCHYQMPIMKHTCECINISTKCNLIVFKRLNIKPWIFMQCFCNQTCPNRTVIKPNTCRMVYYNLPKSSQQTKIMMKIHTMIK